ncbi:MULTISPECIES: bifunctional oligoribonuclease/PAP phosphatase NrnA [unclassified Paenibacillus]|uniref:DHH family phosphoesterase n=1 Tax=unclassified Paenibacillus TaxID=185978 RepID=UPI00240610A1|nr:MULTISPECIES: bifunctional oligoribonuclease/PAP phosphatase NrnA [unclassified Paenibacillus]MDF9841337.1 phosphoesterase RecJ-like protein [Paenibacillus sp. PastF-2]MDF9847928.1 phosphoesterase RecJ-like protein [Paenibacillus sp. PastM-2]MDF9854496.1 phosphoesterase RecJ-like protein [Paenibacillus sp. PastF-1]MDH6479895.1 phosphoesterase RecJ-like protein [Paenibacillus sp. PastH-2]MDH6507203.1 phosphoesterase RecJ-like protein [Paenibacillus sp. PastM-3]
MQSYEQSLQQTREFLLEHDDYLVVSHVQPDGDAVSSTLAVGWLLSCLGKKYTMLNEGPIPKRMEYLWHAGEIVNLADGELPRQYSNIICVDCADFQRVGLTQRYFASDARIVNIDHHPTNNGYGLVTLIKPDAAATAEILFDLLKTFQVEWDLDIATAIYTGLLTDTGGFRYTNTSPKVMAAVSELLALGVNGPELAENLLEEMTLAQVKVLNRALNTLQLSPEGDIAWLYVTPQDMIDCGAANEDLEGIVNYPRNIRGVEVGILFKVINEHAVKASLRSAGKVDVAALAQVFGGGGHTRAAGARIDGTLDEAVALVLQEVRRHL